MIDYEKRSLKWAAVRGLAKDAPAIATLLAEVAAEREAEVRRSILPDKLKEVGDAEWADGGYVSIAALVELRDEMRVDAKERNAWIDAVRHLEAERDQLSADLVAERAMCRLAEGNTDVAHGKTQAVCEDAARLRDDLAEEEATRGRLAALLDGVALALKGEPAPLSTHDWSDLPARATAERERVERLRGEIAAEPARVARLVVAAHHCAAEEAWLASLLLNNVPAPYKHTDGAQ